MYLGIHRWETEAWFLEAENCGTVHIRLLRNEKMQAPLPRISDPHVRTVTSGPTLRSAAKLFFVVWRRTCSEGRKMAPFDPQTLTVAPLRPCIGVIDGNAVVLELTKTDMLKHVKMSC